MSDSTLLGILMGFCIPLLVTLVSLWLYNNWETHTPEWREERLIDWLKRPLPSLDNRGKILNKYYSEEWDEYPYLLVDAIYHSERGSDEVIKWAIHYSTPNKFRENDEEYLRVLLSV